MKRLKYIKFYENFNEDNIVKKNINKIINSYIECAIWTDEEQLKYQDKRNNQEFYKISEEDWDESEIKELVNNIDLNIHNFEENSLIKTYLDIKKFLKLAGDAVNNIEESEIGQDLWLTRNHHGSGFWDRGYDEEISNKLTKAAKSLGEAELYIDNENKINII